LLATERALLVGGADRRLMLGAGDFRIANESMMEIGWPNFAKEQTGFQ
jgi:hypothetical protein